MAQKASAHPRITVGHVTLAAGIAGTADGVACVAGVVPVPGMTAKSHVSLQLYETGLAVSGTRIRTIPGAGGFELKSVDTANDNLVNTDISKFDYVVITAPAQT